MAVMKRLIPILQFTVISLIVGYFSRLLQGSSMETWYPTLVRSSLTPPGYVFSLVWGVLYVLMGISAGIIWSARTSYSWVLISLFFLQLGINLLWSFSFFYMQSPVLGFAVLVALFMFVLVYVAGSYMQNRVAAYLNIPYLLWLMFALYLNGYTAIYN